MADLEQANRLHLFDRVRRKAGGPLMMVLSRPGADPVRCLPVDQADRKGGYQFIPADDLEKVASRGEQPRPRDVAFAALKAEYPHLIPPGFIFECGEGWIGILARYFDEVAAVLPDGAEFRLDNVQSRYGSLAIDASPVRGMPDEVVEVVEKAAMRADARSDHYCETCGQPGKPREGEWASPACEQHAYGGKAVPPETAVYTHQGTRYVYDSELDDVVVLTPDRAAAIPWLEDT